MKQFSIQVVALLFIVQLIACSGGGTGSDSQQTLFSVIEILNPTGQFYVGNEIIVSAEKSYVTNGAIARYEWHIFLNDNPFKENDVAGSTFNYKIDLAGKYRIEVIVFDQDGNSEIAAIELGNVNYKNTDFNCFSEYLNVDTLLLNVACASFQNGHAYDSSIAINDFGQIVSTWQSTAGDRYDLYFAYFDGNNWSARAYANLGYASTTARRNIVIDNQGRSAFLYSALLPEGGGNTRLAYFNQNVLAYDVEIPGLIGSIITSPKGLHGTDLFIDNEGIVTLVTYDNANNGHIYISRLNEQGLIKTLPVYIDDFVEDSRGLWYQIVGDKSSGNIAVHYNRELLIRIINGEMIYTALPRERDPERYRISFEQMNINSLGEVDAIPNPQSFSAGTPYRLHYRFSMDGSFKVFEVSQRVSTVASDGSRLAYIGLCTIESEISNVCPESGYWLTVFDGDFWQATSKLHSEPRSDSQKTMNTLHSVNDEWVFFGLNEEEKLTIQLFEQDIYQKSEWWQLGFWEQSKPSYKISATGYFAFSGMLVNAESEFSGYSIAVVEIDN